MSEELSNENLLIGALWEIRQLMVDAHGQQAFAIDLVIDSTLESLSPPCDLGTWDNDFPKGGQP